MLTSSDEDDARIELAERKYGPLCSECYARLDETDEDQMFSHRCPDHARALPH